MTAGRVIETRPAQTRPAPGLIASIKLLFKEARACLAHAPQPKRKKRRSSGETREAFRYAAVHAALSEMAVYLHYAPPAYDEAERICRWHENNQQPAEQDHTAASAQHNFLSLHL
ncbi:MAG: hypothetical protein JO094_10670 [Hyphomicrobiales bacterium]|nr:hypothetical protein [Hyphomicrobiales bacterium]MBV8831475.1 hypothetical protein [Acidobacteriaceae bacterium]